MRLKYILPITIAGLIMSGCIKERGNNFANQQSSSPNTVDFPNQSEAASLDIVSTPTTYTFYVEANSADGSNPATTVTIAKNADIVTAAGFDYLPDSAYTLVSNTATVDPKTHQAAFQLKVNTTKIDLGSSYAVGYTITSTSNGVIASNKNTDVIGIGAKNKYDGTYALRIKTVGWSAYGIADGTTGDYPGTFDFITAGPNTNTINNANYLGTLQPALTAAGGATGFGATAPIFTFDNSTNKLVAVSNSIPPDSRNRQLAINPTISDSRFDPTTKTIYAAYIMTQTGRPTQYIYDTLTYLHAR